MKFMYLLGMVISTYYLMRWIKKNQRLHILISENKFTQIFQLMSMKHFQDMPKAYLLTGHLQTFLMEIGNKLLNLLKNYFRFFSYRYEREIFHLSDGACVAIDHVIPYKKDEFSKANFEDNVNLTNDQRINFSSKFNENYTQIVIKKKKPINKILVILPGITSNSEDFYIKIFLEDFISEFDCKVINGRGLGGMKLYNEKMVCSDLYHDFWEYINKLCFENPDKKIFSVGFSYGGHILTRCLADYADKLPSNFYAAAGICYPCGVKETECFLEHGIYNGSIIKSIKKIFFNNIENIFNPNTCRKYILDQKEKLIQIMKNAKSIREYSMNYLVNILEYNDENEYYEVSDLKNHINKITVPYLSWFTEDDPVIPISSIPFDLYQKNKNTVTIVSEHGGHLGMFSGTIMPKRFISEPVMNFLKLIDIMRDNNK